jgi:hypothetical protein
MLQRLFYIMTLGGACASACSFALIENCTEEVEEILLCVTSARDCFESSRYSIYEKLGLIPSGEISNYHIDGVFIRVLTLRAVMVSNCEAGQG